MIDFKVYTSSNGPLSIEQLAEMATNDIIRISDSAPAPLREQAHLFQEHVKQVVAKYIQRALDSNLNYLVKETKS
jgi:phage FluMu protein gp41